MSGYGSALAAEGVAAELTDSAGALRTAPPIFVSPGQINYLVPAAAAPGRVSLAVKSP